MYRYENITSNYDSSNENLSYPAFSGDVLNDMAVLTDIRTSPFFETSPPVLPNSFVIPGNDFDLLRALMKQEICYTAASNYCSRYGSPGSLASYETQGLNLIMQRSVSSHSLQKNMNEFHFQQTTELTDSNFDPIRKVFSTGDLHRINMVQQYNPPLSNDSCITEGVNAKASRYSPEKRKERIERYRSKRRHRNFNKKIKYVCRKTLADSRPRIKGRFVRSDEIDQKALCTEWNHHIDGDEDVDDDDDDDDENWIHFLDAF